MIRTTTIERYRGRGRRRAVLLAGLAASVACLVVGGKAWGERAPTGGHRYAEPERSSAVPPERAVWESAPAGAASPRSEVLMRRLDALRRDVPPGDEVYGLVMVTDRHTGERALFARGVPDPQIHSYLEDMRNAPPGVAYFETESAHADDEAEVVIRSVHVRNRRPGRKPWSRDEEEESNLRQRNRVGTMNHRIDGGLRARVLSGGIDLAGTAVVPVAIEMRGVPRLRIPKPRDPATGGLLWAGLELAGERERAIIAHKRAVAELQVKLIDAVEAAGGRLHYAAWTSGAVEADVPARAIPALAARADVFRVDYREPLQEDTHFHGEDYYPATDADDFNPSHAGQHGVTSKHPYSSRVVLAMSEQCIDIGNPAFLTAGGLWDRVWYYDCDPLGACSQGGVEECSGTSSHGTQVAQMILGDFMDGQDPLVANPRRYTGGCEECQMFFLQDQNLNQRTKALDNACDLGVDIFESSISTTAVSCDGNGSYDGTLQDLVDCDAVYVQSASNKGSSGACSTGYPADHPWTFTVGGIATSGDCSSAGEYYTSNCEYDPGASMGGGPPNVVSIIDLAAPYQFGNLITPNTRNPVTFANNAGTSFGTALVAGLMGRLLDWWHEHVSDSLFYNNRLRDYFLLFGDRSSGSAGVFQSTGSYSTRWGAGRVGLVPFDDKDNWGIARASCELEAGETCTIVHSLDPDATFYKAVVWQDGTDYANEPGIGLTLNPSGCATSTTAVTYYDNKAIRTYTPGSAVGPLDGCTGMTITIENVQNGTSGTRLFHFGAYSDVEDERN